MEGPLMFIQTPPFYSIEVDTAEEEPQVKVATVEEEPQAKLGEVENDLQFEVDTIEENVQQLLEESTSVYELSRAERITDPVIARQLNYFLQPINQHRLLVLHLANGEKVVGKIEEMIGIQVKLKMDVQEILINANDIKVISTAKKSL